MIFKDSSDVLFSIVITFIVVVIGGNCCISCRSVEKCSATSDSSYTKVADRSTDSISQRELKRLLEEWSRTLTFRRYNVTSTKDSIGNEVKQMEIQEYILNENERRDSSAQKENVSEHKHDKDSTATSHSESNKEVSRSPPTTAIGIILIFIIFLFWFFYRLKN